MDDTASPSRASIRRGRDIPRATARSAADRALLPGTDTDQPSATWEIVRPLPPDSFSQSVVASYYQDRDGGGIQYHFTTPLSELEQDGYVRRVT